MTTSSKMEIAVLDGRTIRKFITRLKKMGGDVNIDRPNLKKVTSGGETIFSALKYSSGWDCRVHRMFISDLKSCLA
jgi:hypothetical protein